jgi:N-carbamoyl-L-amino-acid hydrolase
MMGSGVFAEKFTLEETLAKVDADGVTVGEALNAIGYAGSREVSGHKVGAYFEAHIEQGPILEDEQKTIGVVLGALGQKWFDLKLRGVEVLRTLNDLGVETEAPLEVVVWTNEEGSRFAPCMMGSGVFAEKFTLEETLAKVDADGVTVGEALNAIGYAGSRKVSGHKVGAYFEAHIEQGPILEDEQKTIGVVLGALGQKWFDLKLRGVEAHAGPTPMHLRKDALVGASVIVGAVNRAALGHQPHACGTVGCLQAYPGSRNVIPGEVRMTLDFRHLQPERLDSMISEVKQVIEATCEEHGLTYELTPTADFPPLYFEKGCVEAVRGAAKGLGLSHMDIVSGAGHDAIFLAELGPAGMIFVPCEGGISHNEIENAAPDDLAAGCAVLLRAMLAASAMVAAGQRAA